MSPNKDWNPFKNWLNSQAFKKLKFGGITGKLTLLGIVGVISSASIGVHSPDPKVQSTCAIAGLVFAFMLAVGILAFSFKHPDQATLEGTEVLAYQQLQRMGAKDIPSLDAIGSSTLSLEGIGTPPKKKAEEEL